MHRLECWLRVAMLLAAVVAGGCHRDAPTTSDASDHAANGGAPARTSSAKQTIAFTNVTVIDGTGAAPLVGQNVLISGGTIVAIGPAGSIPVPENARVVDARNKFLIPGLWDLHTHLRFGTPEVLPVFVAYGVTGIRELSTDMTEIRRIRVLGKQGRLVQPRILAAGLMVEAEAVRAQLERFAPPDLASALMQDRIFIDSPEAGRAAVREMAALGVDLIKHHAVDKRALFFAVADEARRLRLPVAGHFPHGEKVTLREVADAGQNTIEHIGWPDVAKDFAALDASGRRELLAHIKERQLAFVPTLGTTQVAETASAGTDGRMGSAERLEQARLDPRARYVAPSLWKEWGEMISLIDAASRASDVPKPDYAADVALLREFNKAGVAILPGTDFTVQFLFPGSSLHEELQALVRQVGMSAHEVLQAATRRAAEQMGLQGRTGTVQPGKEADLVLLTANPLVDIANTQQIAAVVRAGRLFDRRELNELLDEAAQRLRSAQPSTPHRAAEH